MRIIFVYVVSALFLLGLAACGSENTSSPDSAAYEAGTIIYAPIPTLEPVQTIINQYKTHNNELLALIFAHMASFSSYFQSIYIPIPPDIILYGITTQDALAGLPETVILGLTPIGDFLTAADLFNVLFNAPTEPPLALMSYAAAEVVQHTTILNYFYNKGYITKADVSLVQDSFGNFMQRIGAIQDIGGNSARYHRAHNEMLDLYSKFWANVYIVDFLESLPVGDFATPCEDTVNHLSEYLALALYDVQNFINTTGRIYTLPLYFDEPRAREIERTYGLAGVFLSIPLAGVIGHMTAPNIEVAIHESQRVVYSNIMRVNNFATETLNSGIAELNVTRQKINQRAELFQNMLDDPRSYLPVFASLEFTPKRAELLDFAPCLYDFEISMRIVIDKTNVLYRLFSSTFLASPERNAYLARMSGIRRMLGHIDPEHDNWAGLRTIYFTDYNRDKIFSYINSRVDPIRINSAWLLTDIFAEWAWAEFSGLDTGLNFSYRNASAMFIPHANNNMRVARMSTGIGELTIMIAEFSNTGTIFNPSYRLTWFTLYCPFSIWPIFTECALTGNFAIFHYSRLLYASSGWRERGEDWITDNIYSVLADLNETVHIVNFVIWFGCAWKHLTLFSVNLTICICYSFITFFWR